jgi:transmembrane sensor
VESHKDNEHQAAMWLAKRDAGGWSDDDEANFAQWIEFSVARRVAFLRLEGAWSQAGRLGVLGAELPPGAVPRRWRASPFFALLPENAAEEISARPRRKVHLAAAAAGTLIVIAAASMLLYFLRDQQYSTPIGGLASMSLKDGSEVTLDTASRIRVELRARERRVNLLNGEAFFSVAKDSRRPFIVQAGATDVVAVGTQFSVRRDHGELRVAVIEGTVRLDAPPLGDRESRPSGVTMLTVGEVATVTDHGVFLEKESIAQLEDMLSWREAYLTFHETTLAGAIAEFNRYNTRKIVITDPQVAAIRISGTFRPTHIQAFARLLTDGFSIRVIDTQDTTILLAR